jgi:RimJ/RimL family protein N-acetyltransferase
VIVRGALEAAPDLALTVISPRAALGELGGLIGSRDVTIREFTVDLPALAVQHSLVVSAAGISALEFAHLGVPMALVCVADNQIVGYREMVGCQAAIPLGRPPFANLGTRLAEALRAVHDPPSLARLASHGRRLVDGLGAWRVVSAWESLGQRLEPATARVKVRPAQLDDSPLLLAWRNDPFTRRMSRDQDEVDQDQHERWLRHALADPKRRLLVATVGHEAVGTLRWDQICQSSWEVSVTVAPNHRGRGLAAAIIEAGETALPSGTSHLLATIHCDNLASSRAFLRAGYLPYRPPDRFGFGLMSRWCNL